MKSFLYSQFLLRPAVALLLLAASASAQAPVQLPAELSFLNTLVQLRKEIPFDLYEEAKFPDGTAQRGKHWNMIGVIPGTTDVEKGWATVKAVFIQNGWTSVKSIRAGGFREMMSYSRNGVQAWVTIDIEGNPLYIFVEAIEGGPPPFSLTLNAPAAEPEKISINSDFPYLAPLPGSRAHAGQIDPGAFMVTPKDSSQAEMVAPSGIVRSYDLPALSNLLFVTAYKDALTKAGWTIVNDGKASINAHYTQKGRNIWTYLIFGGGGYSIKVADAGSLSTSLAKTCHAALYGVLFDFNKSTLQAVSDGVLQQVAGILAADKTLKLEVQGHTDNVGNDAYNQTLSEARAKSVMTWLTQHGVAADRLTFKGYGKTKPVADNGTDEGRAKNRRVEIADPQCTPKAN